MEFPENLVYRLHAVRRMFERNISEEAIMAILKNGIVIQKYVDDKPYPSYLIAGEYKKQPLHIVVSVNNEDQTTIVITAYIPDLTDWETGYTMRRKKWNV